MMKLLTRDSVATDQLSQKRRYERRHSDQCVAAIGGKLFPVINWSQGGVLLFAEDRMFATGDQIEILMKFNLNNRIIHINQTGQIIRKGAQRIAVQFDTLGEHARRSFHEIIDATIAREFADSQV